MSIGVDSELVPSRTREPFIHFFLPSENQSIFQHSQPGYARGWLPEGRHSRRTGTDVVVTVDGTECAQEAIVHSSCSQSQHWMDSSPQGPKCSISCERAPGASQLPTISRNECAHDLHNSLLCEQHLLLLLGTCQDFSSFLSISSLKARFMPCSHSR